MAEQIKIRTLTQGDVTDIRILMQHPMETGQRRDERGQALRSISFRHLRSTSTENR